MTFSWPVPIVSNADEPAFQATAVDEVDQRNVCATLQ